MKTEVTTEEYHEGMNKIIKKGLPVNEALVEMLGYASTVTIEDNKVE